MRNKLPTGPKPFPKIDRRIPRIVTLSPREYVALAKVRGDVPFSTWARGVLLRALTEDPSPISDTKKKPKK